MSVARYYLCYFPRSLVGSSIVDKLAIGTTEDGRRSDAGATVSLCLSVRPSVRLSVRLCLRRAYLFACVRVRPFARAFVDGQDDRDGVVGGGGRGASQKTML